MFRSDCRAWSASLIYVCGLSLANPGYSVVHLKPNPEIVESAHGQLVTGLRNILIGWKRREHNIQLVVEAFADMTINLVLGSSSETYQLQKRQGATKRLVV